MSKDTEQIRGYCCTGVQLALSAASPIYRGFLADTDCRWNVIAASVDDRTREERGLDVSLALFLFFLDVYCYFVHLGGGFNQGG